MIPRGLLPGMPIEFEDVRPGDVIDTYDPDKWHESRYHARLGQRVYDRRASCDIFTDYDMICRNFNLWIQLRHRPKDDDHA